jgi:glycosyltransferase involved in cell wall biosynthesis
MRIVFLSTSSIDDPSPRGRWLPVSRELARMGHEPRLLLLHPTFDALAEKTHTLDGVVCEHVAQMHVYGYPGARRYFSAPQLIGVSLSAAWALARAAIAAGADAIHICKPQPINALAGWLTRLRTGCRWYVDCDDYEAEANRFGGGWQKSLVRWFEDTLPKHTDGATVNTRFLFQRLVELGVPRAKIHYVPNGIHAPQTIDVHTPSQPIVAYVGTMSKISHGTDLLLDAFTRVHAQFATAQLWMIGDGDDRPALEAQAARLGIASVVRWWGRVAPIDVPPLLTQAVCSVDPVSDAPAMRARSPLKIVESLALGVPIVTGDVGDRRETLRDGACGVIVGAGDTEALANGILSVLRDAALHAYLARNAIQRSYDFDWSVLAREWAEGYSA